MSTTPERAEWLRMAHEDDPADTDWEEILRPLLADLEAAEQERDDQRNRADENLAAAKAWQAEAEKAQAEVIRLGSVHMDSLGRAVSAEAELKRLRDSVEALADAWNDRSWSGHDTAAPFARAIRALLGGDA